MNPFKAIANLYNLAFGCRHSDYTWPRTTPGTDQTHVACLNCGKDIPYNFQHLGGPAAATLPPLMTQPGAETFSDLAQYSQV